MHKQMSECMNERTDGQRCECMVQQQRNLQELHGSTNLILRGSQPLSSKASERVLRYIPQGGAQPSILGEVSHQAQLNLAVVC